MMQQVYFGPKSLHQLATVLDSFPTSNVFLVTGKDSYRHCGAEQALAYLLRDKQVTRFSDFATNPKMEDVRRGVQLFRESAPGLVIAVGGGSVIDIAKSINILSFHDEPWESYAQGTNALSRSGVPFIAIPTTSGAGSEATHFAVVYVNQRKYSLAHPSMVPNVAIIDPELTYTLSPTITASTGIDALCQAIESAWSVHSTPESIAWAHQAIIHALNSLETAVLAPSNEARIRMSEAAYLAGRAINISKTTACHALSYPLTAHFGVSHGQAVALTLSGIFRHNSLVSTSDLNDPRGIKHIQETVNTLMSTLGTTDIDETESFLTGLMRRIGLATSLGELGIHAEHIDQILAEASLERLKNNPRTLSAEQAKALFTSLL